MRIDLFEQMSVLYSGLFSDRKAYVAPVLNELTWMDLQLGITICEGESGDEGDTEWEGGSTTDQPTLPEDDDLLDP